MLTFEFYALPLVVSLISISLIVFLNKEFTVGTMVALICSFIPFLNFFSAIMVGLHLLNEYEHTPLWRKK
jgi:hypothetical protein